ncbi:MAG: DegQ family serine endoprotease [Nitrospiraceae bacterium]|nr:DegQ family serine endoprotease [Nitrospiraceae bacterium]
MKSRTKVYLAAAGLIAIGIFVGLILSSSFEIATKGYADYKISDKSIETLTRISDAMAELSQAVEPTVVNISTTRTIKTPGVRNPFFNDPFFKKFFGDGGGFGEEPHERKAMSLGSGVIVDPNGYILTNNHVIKGAEEIKVTLADKRVFKGKIIGADAKTDLAVVKIDAKNLPAIKWGNSDKLRTGDMIIAIGSPYGLNQTVTSGIVSAVGRANVGIADYEDFIQTDASINPGNSGGPLVNARGELVGINTAIFSTTGGYQGIGFAIPSNMAQVVMESLIKHGKVIRGWLGIWIQPLSPELAKKFGLKSEKGALVSDIVEGGPADKAGIKRGDFITEFNGKKIDDPTQLRNMVADTPPGREVPVKLIRNGQEISLNVKIAEQSEEESALKPQVENALAGVNVQDITPSLRQNMRLPQRIQGVIITSIAEDSPAQDVLQSEDIIMEVNRTKVKNVNDYLKVVSGIKPDESILLLVYRQGQTFYLTLSSK